MHYQWHPPPQSTSVPRPATGGPPTTLKIATVVLGVVLGVSMIVNILMLIEPRGDRLHGDAIAYTGGGNGVNNNTSENNTDNDDDPLSTTPSQAVARAVVNPLRPVHGKCPVGFRLLYDESMDAAYTRECELNFNEGDDIDTSLFDPNAAMCDDPEQHYNGRWIFGRGAARPPWGARTWDTLTYNNDLLLASIKRTEMQLLWGHDEVQQLVTECALVRSAHHTGATEMMRLVERIVPPVIESRDMLMQTWGAMAAIGAVHPIYATLERRHPTDHTKRLVFLQQAGVLEGLPCQELAGNSDHADILRQLAARFGVAQPEAAARKVVRIERLLCDAFASTHTDDFLQYVRTEFTRDLYTYDGASELLGRDLSLMTYYKSLFTTLDLDVAANLAAVRATGHWVFRATYFAALARIVPLVPLEDWAVYCRLSVLYDMDIVAHGGGPHGIVREGIQTGVVDSSRTEGRDDDSDRNFQVGMKSAWLMPTHAMRKPLWHSSIVRATNKGDIPRAVLAPRHIRAVHRTEQGMDSLRAHIAYSKYAEECGVLAYYVLPDHFDRLFVQSVLRYHDISRVVRAIENLRTAASDDVRASDYTDETKRVMLAKIKNVKLRMGSQSMDRWLDPSDVLASKGNEHHGRLFWGDEEDDDIEVEDDAHQQSRFVQVVFDLRRAAIRAAGWNLLVVPNTGLDDIENAPFAMPASIANAWHNPQDPSLNIAAGILAMPLYHTHYSDTAVYAKLITVVAHEFAHMFDNAAGVHFDEFGSVRDWMDPVDKPKWEHRVACITSQYSQRTRYGNQHDGANTIGESMADTFAIRWAHKALAVALHPRPVNTTAFVIMYAQVWADASSPSTDRSRIVYDTHPVPEFRINQVLRNFAPFATNECGKEPVCTMFPN